MTKTIWLQWFSSVTKTTWPQWIISVSTATAWLQQIILVFSHTEWLQWIISASTQNDQWFISASTVTAWLQRFILVSNRHDFSESNRMTSESLQCVLEQHDFKKPFQCQTECPVKPFSVTQQNDFSVYWAWLQLIISGSTATAWLQWIISVCTQHGFGESFQCVLRQNDFSVQLLHNSVISVIHFSVYSAWFQWLSVSTTDVTQWSIISVCTQHGFSDSQQRESFQCVLRQNDSEIISAVAQQRDFSDSF